MFFEDKPTSAVAYCRVSSEKQEKDDTIQNQLDFAENYCKLHNIELTHIYKDDGITGILPMNERPAGAEMLQDAKKCKFTLVLVFKLDRLGRNTQVILNTIHDLDGMGVKVRSMTEPFDTADASGRFLMTILAGVADLERSTILQRMGMGLDRVARAGKTAGGVPPFGYRFNADNTFALSTTPLPNINMSKVDVVRMMYNLCLQGLSAYQIADRFNAMGIPTSTDCREGNGFKTKWRGSTIFRMLKSTTYKGTNYYNKRGDKQPIPRPVPPIVSEETWDKVQIELASHKAMIKGNAKRQYLLRGLIKCKICGHTYAGQQTRKYAYYVCNGRHNWKPQRMEKQCPSLTLNKSWIEDTVWESCLEFIRNPQLVVKSIKGEISKSEELEREIALIHIRMGENATSKQRLIELYKNGLISLDDVSGEFEKVDKEKQSLQVELENLESQRRRDDLLRQIDSANDLLVLLRDKVDTPDVPFETKKTVVQIMVDKVVVDSPDDKSATVTICFKFGNDHTRAYRRRKNSHIISRATPRETVLEITKSFVYTK